MEKSKMENEMTIWEGRVIDVKKSPYCVAPGKEMLQYYSQLANKPIECLKYDKYEGMHLDVTFSLYDTESKIIELGGSRYRLPRHVTVEVYDEVMEALGKQRMSSNLYDMFVNTLEGQKCELGLIFIEETLQKKEGNASIEAAFLLPIKVKGEPIVGSTTIYLTAVL